jgi:FtsH-binding integral membrane protein
MSDKPVFSSQVDVLGADNAVSTNKVLRNTYMLLGMTLAFSAATAGTSMALGLSHMAGTCDDASGLLACYLLLTAWQTRLKVSPPFLPSLV